MNASVSATLISELTTLQTSAIDLFVLILPIAGTVFITVALVTFGINFFLRFMGFRSSEPDVEKGNIYEDY